MKPERVFMNTVHCVSVMSLSLMLNLGAEPMLVKISEVNSDIRYTKTRQDSMGCYLCPKAAQCLSEAQKEMKAKGYCLVVDEAYVPYSSQKTNVENDSCVSCKEECMRHSCGNAVDVYMEMQDGRQLPMPTALDVFTPEARMDCMNLPCEAIENRAMLCDVMERHGFKVSPNMWYHFECMECSSCNYLDISAQELAAQ